MKSITFFRLTGVGLLICFQIAFIGLIDFLTGYELGFFVFYFLPVGYAAWTGGRLAGGAASVFSAVVWLILDMINKDMAFPAPIDWWNAGIRLFAYLLFALAFARVRELLDVEREMSGRLQASLDQVRELRGMLPICAACKRIRDDDGYWQQIESYISTRSRAEFTHGICPECARELYPEYYGGGRKDKDEEQEPPEEREEGSAP